MRRLRLGTVLIAVAIAGLWMTGVLAQGMFGAKPVKLPAKIAFIRDKNIWLLAADGSGETKWIVMENVIGRLSWNPDGKRIVFGRQGEFSYSLPDGGGGQHRLYDIFAKHADSTRANAWWWVTNNHGSFSPEWSRDGQSILYVHDINANQVDAELPDYQIEWRDWRDYEGKNVHALTRKGAGPRQSQGIQPTWSPDQSKVAFIFLKDKAPIGLVIEPSTGILRSEADLEKAAKEFPNVSYPQWSPDGKSIAYVSADDKDNGIYLLSPDTMNKKRIFEKTSAITPHQAPVCWSSDSKWLTFASVDGYVYIMDAGGKNVTKVTSGGNDYYPAFCPK